MPDDDASVLILSLSLIWVGMIIGVSFYAAPVKFLAIEVPLKQLLTVGQITFQGFQWLERILLLIMVLLTMASLFIHQALNHRQIYLWGIASLIILIFIQQVWVYPTLNERTLQVIQGAAPSPSPSNFHHYFVGIDLCKVLILLGIAWLIADVKKTGESTL